jgi:trans-2-enoyl-CoA reductase
MKEEGIHEGCIEQIQRLYAIDCSLENSYDEKEEFVLMIGNAS